MKKILATAGAIAVLALTSASAQAASPSADASATAKIYRPLVITKTADLDFGVIVIAGAAFPAEAVTVDTAGGVTCGGGTNLTCSGSPTAAQFHLVGSDNADVTVSSPSFSLSGPAVLTVTPSSLTQVVNLGGSGSSTGVDVDLGGSINVASTTPEGVYTGTWTVTADYQ
jgi:Mat/Ecp fimbriae major subunit